MTTLDANATPSLVEISPGQEFTLTVRIANLSDLIDGYSVRIFGLDPQWVRLEPRRLSLFPSDSGTVDVTVTVPDDFPAGMRTISIYVQSENQPTEFVISTASIDVTSTPRVSLTLDPQSQTGGTRAQFGMVVTNTGNSIVDGIAEAVDPEEEAAFVFTPPTLRLLPGERDVVQVAVKAPRPWMGAPKVRVLTFSIASHAKVETIGTLMQRPRISRGLITLLGLITAAAVFAAVLSSTLSRVVDRAKVGDQIIEQALSSGGSAGALKVDTPGSITGTIRATTSGNPVPGVRATLYHASDASTVVKTSATADDGVFRFAELPEGTYRIKFSGAGFADSWWKNGRNFAEAENIELAKGENLNLDEPSSSGGTGGTGGTGATTDTVAGGGGGATSTTVVGGAGADPAQGGIALVGLPGTVSGTVIADDPTGATATLIIKGRADADVPAVVASIAVSANGAFELKNVPTPQVYTLVVDRLGNATETRTIDLAAGASATDVEIALRIGEGLISGTVTGDGQPLGGALVEATDGTNKVSTVSVTEGTIGSFSLRNLPVPGTYTITVTAPNFAPASLVVDLTDNNPTANRDVFLTSSVASITGSTRDSNGVLGGVTVTVTGPDATVTTATDSQGPTRGQFLVADLPLPAAYTLTFSKTGYVDLVRLVNLDPLAGTADPVDVVMSRSTASVVGQVLKADGTPAGLADVSLSNGTFVRNLRTASQPTADVGQFEFADVPAGSYTFSASLAGTEAIVMVVTVTADQQLKELGALQLGAQATISGRVTFASGQAPLGAEVRLYFPSDFPPNAASVPAVPPVTLGADGTFTFTAIDAPVSYVIALFAGKGDLTPLASDVVNSVPGKDQQHDFLGIG